MPPNSPIPRHKAGKTFIVASSLLGIAALIQIGAVAWAMIKKSPGPAASAASSAVPSFIPPSQLEALAAGPLVDDEKSGLPVAAIPLSVPIIPPSRPVPVLEPAPRERPPATLYDELVKQGITLRDRGDTGSAFTKLREAQALQPANPKAISEIAMTYEKVGAGEKAAELWKKILQMGEGTGTYYVAADARLKQSQALAMMAAQGQAGANSAPTVANPNATLAVDAITTHETSDPAAARKFQLRVPLKLRLPGQIDVRDVAVHVHFYDVIDGKTLVQTSANVNYRWASPPLDWADENYETLEVEYTQPKADPREVGREDRKYFGYIVRVYYKSELQDTRAEPIRLAAQFTAPQTLEKDPFQ